MSQSLLAMGRDASDDDLILAAAYQADRLRREALNLAGWTVAFLKTTGRESAVEAAVEFAHAAVGFAAVLIWNDVKIVGRGGWFSQAKVAEAAARDLTKKMPEFRDIALTFAEMVPVSPREALRGYPESHSLPRSLSEYSK